MAAKRSRGGSGGAREEEAEGGGLYIMGDEDGEEQEEDEEDGRRAGEMNSTREWRGGDEHVHDATDEGGGGLAVMHARAEADASGGRGGTVD